MQISHPKSNYGKEYWIFFLNLTPTMPAPTALLNKPDEPVNPANPASEPTGKSSTPPG